MSDSPINFLNKNIVIPREGGNLTLPNLKISSKTAQIAKISFIMSPFTMQNVTWLSHGLPRLIPITSLRKIRKNP